MAELASYDIVISTYDTLRADWGGGQKAAGSLLFSTPWKRIILDEAHVIRNTKSQISQAVCDLKAAARWAVTGTPIQNRIGDPAALLKFIRAYPYHEAKRFESDIGQIWKTGEIEKAVDRLRKLSGGLILRRPKRAIKLPQRKDRKFPIKFSAPERELYDKVKDQAMAKIEEAFRDGDGGGLGSSSYITVMQRINALRMICDLGLNYDSRHHLAAAEDEEMTDSIDWLLTSQDKFDVCRENSSIACSSCDSTCETTHEVVTSTSPRSYFATCLAYICSDCAQPRLRKKQPITCGHTPSHSVAPVSLSWTRLEERGATAQPSHMERSSKATALILELRSCQMRQRGQYHVIS